MGNDIHGSLACVSCPHCRGTLINLTEPFGQVGAGTTSYKFAVNAIAKVFPFQSQMINGWPPPAEQARYGSPEGAFAALIHQAENWRNPPEPEDDAPTEWVEVTPDEVVA